MKRRAVIAVIWAAGLALILLNGWITAMWIYIGVSVFLLFAGALSKDEKERGQKKQRPFKGVYANEAGGGHGPSGVSETVNNGGKGILTLVGYSRDQMCRDAADAGEAAAGRRNRAD